ncbi:MAG: hypothetical protein KY454_10690 [Actinobacteria bacterium]|nr:hypothetical protein [Actinomycetota bacterium]
MTDQQVEQGPLEQTPEAPRQSLSKLVTASIVVTAVATTIIAMLLLYAALGIRNAAKELAELGGGAEEVFDAPADEPFGEEFEGGGESWYNEQPEEGSLGGRTGGDLRAELDQLEVDFGPGPTPSAIRRMAELGTDVSNSDLRRYGLGVCFGAIAGPEHLATESGLSLEEAERMIATAEGWCSA